MFTENPYAIIGRQLADLIAGQDEIRQLLRNTATHPATAEETPVTADEAARQYGIAKQTLYQNVKKIKHTKRFGRLYFYPSDLRAYLDTGA